MTLFYKNQDMENLNSLPVNKQDNTGKITRQIKMVKVIYISTILILSVLAIIKIILPPSLNPSDFMIWALIIVYSGIFLILRNKNILIAGLIHSSVLWIALTVLAYSFEGVRDVTVYGYTICILIVINIDQFRNAFILGILSFLAIWGLYVLESYGKIIPEPSSSLNYTIVLSAIFSLILVLLYRSYLHYKLDKKKLKEDFEQRLQIEIELLNKEKALRESKMLTREIFDLYYGFMGILDIDGVVLDVNSTALDFSGITIADVKGKYFWDTPWWSHSAAARDQVRNAIEYAREGHQVKGEALHQDKYGNLRMIDFSIKPVKNEEGKVVLLIPEGFDITERKNTIRNLETLSHSAIEMINMPLHENIYEVVIDKIKELLPQDSVIIINLLDPETNKFRIRSISALSAELELQLKSQAFDNEGVNNDFNAVLMKILSSGKLEVDKKGIGLPFLNKYFLSENRNLISGKVVYIMGFVKSGKILGALEILTVDQMPIEIIKTIEALGSQLSIVLDKRNAEISLRSSEERYRSIVETTTDWIWEIDLCGRLTFTNSAISTLLGYHPAEIREHTIFDLQDQDSFLESRAKYPVLIREKLGWREWMLRWRHKDGSIRILESNANPILDESGNLLGYRGTDRDVTNRVREEEYTRAALQRRKAQQEAIGQIAASPMLAEGNVKGLISFITVAASKIFNCERVSIWMLNEENLHQLECIDLYDSRTDSHSSGLILDSSEYLRNLANEKAFLYFDSDDPLYNSVSRDTIENYILPNGISSILFSPISVNKNGRQLGVLSVEHVTRKHHWEHDEKTFARQLADQIILVFKNQETRKSEQMLKRKSDLQALMTKISTTYLFIPLDSLDNSIYKSLGELSELLGSDRSFLSDYDFVENVIRMRIEWESDTLKGHIKETGSIPLNDLSGWDLEAHLRGEIIFIPDLQTIPGGRLKNITSSYGGKTLIAVPLMKSGECLGFLGFVWLKQIKNINADELNILRIFALMLVNISIRKTSQDALVRSEEKFRELVENMNDVFFTLDIDGNITYISPQVQMTYKMDSPTAMIGKPLTDYILADDHQTILSGFQDTLNHNIKLREFRYINNEGEIRWAVSSSRPIFEKGIVTGVRGILTDVTLRKQNEEELKKLSVAIEQSPVVIIITDLAGNIDYVNPKFSELTGYSRNETLGKNPRILKSGKTKTEIYSEMWSRISSGKEWRGEFLNRKKNGDLFWEAALISPILNSAGDVTHYLAVKEDITDKREATKLIFDKIIETEERERLRYSEEIHDGLGPIISTIKLYFQLLSEDNDSTQRDIILSKANTCIDEAILTIKEISFNLSPNILNKFGLVAGIQNFVSRLKDVCPFSIDYQCNVERRFEKNTEISVYRIITEMINNTVKYASATAVRIYLNYNKEESSLTLEYSDNGAGFDLNDTIINPKGLGLSNIYHRVNTLGGSIEIESAYGKGMKARIDLTIFN